MKKILLYDPYSSGHHREYFEHVIHYMSKAEGLEMTIICSPEIEGYLTEIARVYESPVRIEAIEARIIQKIESTSRLIIRGYRDACCLKDFVKRYEPDLVVALYINTLQPFLNFPFFRSTRARIRGILFDPIAMPGRGSGGRPAIRGQLKVFRKMLQLKWLSLNGQVEKVFVLNDLEIAKFLNRNLGAGRDVFGFIPDPIPLHVAEKTKEIGAADGGLRSGRKVFLLIGSLDRRKGVLEALNTMERLDGEFASEIHLKIVGKFRAPDFETKVMNRVVALKEKGFSIELCVGWVDDTRFFLEMAACDLVLIPYCGFQGSSGLIGNACALRKPILATNEGLVGELVIQRRLGRVVNPREVEAFAQAMRLFLQEGWSHSLEQQVYAEQAESDEFVRKLLH